MFLHLGHLLLTHRPTQQVGLPQGIARQILRDPHDLLLIHHDSVGFAQNRLKNGVGEINRFPAMFAVDEFGNQPGIEGTRAIQRQDR